MSACGMQRFSAAATPATLNHNAETKTIAPTIRPVMSRPVRALARLLAHGVLDRSKADCRFTVRHINGIWAVQRFTDFQSTAGVLSAAFCMAATFRPYFVRPFPDSPVALRHTTIRRCIDRAVRLVGREVKSERVREDGRTW